MEKILISGEWKFTKEALTPDNFFSIDWESVVVPHTWNGIDGQDGGNDYHRGQCWYQKNIEIKKTNERIYLEFEGVNSIATVLLNGEMLGSHKGGYSTFRFDVTDIAKEGENLLVVGVDNQHYEEVYPLMADFTFYGGIYRDAYIVYANETSFDLTHVGTKGVYVSQKNVSNEIAEFSVDAYVKNFADKKDVKVSVQLMDGEVLVLDKSMDITVEDVELATINMSLENPRLWNGVEDPFMYTIVVRLFENGDVIDERIIPQGFRFFHFDDEAFYLNGNRYLLNGVSRHQDRVDVGNALTKEMHDEDMEIIKEVGANSIRLAHYQQSQYFYDLCDKEGMVVWAEIPYISLTSKTDLTGANAMSQMEELVKQCYNHTSIVMWGVQNETTIAGKKNNLEEIVQKLHDLTKEIDPYRVTTQAQVAMHPLKDSMNEITDVVAFNQYFGWYMGEAEEFGPWLDEYRRLNPDRPIGLSEYGAEGIIRYHSDTPVCKDYTEEYHALWHEKVYEILISKPYVWGTYVWNMFTFAADARDEGGVKGLNNKGLVTFDRKTRKDAFYYYQAKWSKNPMVHLCSKRFMERHNKDIELKVYSNQDDVTIYLNGEAVAHQVNGVIYTAKVTLVDGENKVRVEANGLSDETVFVTVDEINETYTVPQSAQGKGIFSFDDAGNWFDDLQEGEETQEFDPTCFSIKDTISDILAKEEGMAIFKKYLQSFLDHPMFEMAQGFTLEMIVNFDPKALPEGLVILLNRELQKIKK